MSMRRTRAMGLSPSGAQALDLKAPIRRPRKAKESVSSAAKPALNNSVPRARGRPKRKNENTAGEERPAKKSRTQRTKAIEASQPNHTAQALASVEESESLAVQSPSPSIGASQAHLRQEYDDDEDEKALSECDDDEWARRIPSVMSRYNATANRGSPCMRTSKYLPLISTTSCPVLRARGLTHSTILVAISASIDWFEKNPRSAIPTAAEMTSLLDDFNRSKQPQATKPTSQQSQSTDTSSQEDCLAQNISDNVPVTPEAQRSDDDLHDNSDALEDRDTLHDNNVLDHYKDRGIEQREIADADDEQQEVEPAEPRTPAPQQEPQTPRGWAAALSASVIGNMIRTPVNWFSRRDRDRARQNPSATEVRPVKPLNHPRRNAHPNGTSALGNNTLPSKVRSSRGHDADLLPSTPTPTARQPRKGGRPDSHLPVHLRGVRFEDLPPEWQAVSHHMKEPEPPQEEEVDFPALLKLAEKNREERRLRELKEKAERIAREQQNVYGAEEDVSQSLVGGKRKRTVTVTQHKVFSAKLGHSTFGLPTNIDDDSSDEDIEVEVELSPVSSTETGRQANLLKNVRFDRSSHQRSSFDSDGDNEEDHEAPPSKKARLENDEPIRPWTGFFTKEQREERHRARPASGFLGTPPREAARRAEAQEEYEQINRIPDDMRLFAVDPKDQEELDKAVAWHLKDQRECNIFRETFKKTGKIPFPCFSDPPKKFASFSDESSDSHSVSNKPSDEVEFLGRRPLQESSDARLNKVREQALKYKPKVPSSLQVTQIMSPIAERRLLGRNLDDQEVVEAIWAIREDEIVAESFGEVPSITEKTVSREATQALLDY